MTNRRTTKQLLVSVVLLIVCILMLLGTTFAWFTDNATSPDNKIEAGTLDVEMYWAEGKEDPNTTTAWADASKGPMFNYELWEPGYVAARQIKISNKGTLDFKYKLNIIANGEVTELADVIDVYFIDPAVQLADRAAIPAEKKIGTLTEVLAGLSNGNLGANELGAGKDVYVTIALKMQESAGNEYQDLGIGSSFSIQLLATQVASEKDSFGTDYDKDATYPEASVPEKLPETGSATKEMALETESTKTLLSTDVLNNILDKTDAKSLATAHETPIIDVANKKVSINNFEVVDENGEIVDLKAMNNDKPVTVTVQVGAAFSAGEIVVIYHDDEAVASAVVSAQKTVTYTATHFCDIVVSMGDGKIDTEVELIAALAAGGSFELEGDITSVNGFVVTADTALDLNGYTLTATGERAYLFTVEEDGIDFTLTNGKLVAESTNHVLNGTGTSTGASSSVVFASQNGTLTMIGVEIAASVRGGHRAVEVYYGNATLTNVDIVSYYGSGVNASHGANVVLNDCDITVNGMYSAPYNSVCFSVMNEGVMTINSGNYKLINDNTYSTGDTHGGWVGIVMNSGGTITTKGGTFTNVPADGFVPQYERAIIEGENVSPSVATINLIGGTFVPQSSKVYSGYGIGDSPRYPVFNGILTDNGDGTWTASAPVYVGEEGFVTLQDAVNAAENGATIVLNADVTVAEPVMIPVGKEIVIELNGKSLSTTDIGAIYAINNHGTLTIKDRVGTGTVNARGMYNGYNANENHVATAKLTIEGGTFNAMGTNGGAAVYNYGVLDINGGTFKSNGGYALNNQATGVTTVSGASATGGIYNLGTLTVEGTDVMQHISGRHAIYNWCGNVTINSGNFDSISGNELILADGSNATVTINGGTFNKTAKSWLFGAATGKNITFVINGGTFNGYVNLPENTVDTIRPFNDPIVVYGGTYNFNPTQWLAEGYQCLANGDNTFSVITKTEGIDLAVVANYPHLFTDGTNYYVYDAQGLIAMRDYWQANQYANKMWGRSYNIMADIDATGYTWNSVYVVVGHNGNDGFIIDGHDHTISGLTIKDSMFTGTPNGGDAGTKPGEVKNINFDNVKVTGDHWTAVVWGNTYGEIVFDDVHIVNSTISGKCNTAAFVGGTAQESGDVTITFNNCSVEKTSISANGAFSGVKGDGASDPNGANVFISRAFNKAYIVFKGENVSESNTVTNTNGVIGGGIYGYTAFVDGWWAGFGTCDKFENWNGLVVTSNVADVVNGGNFLLTDDIQNNSAIKNDTSIDLNGNTFEATGSYNLNNNADFTMTNGKYVANGTYGHIDVRSDSTEGSTLLFENIDFSFNKLEKSYGPSTNRLGSVVEITPAAAGAHVVAVFKNCTFNNAKVLFEGMSGKTGTFVAIFENCTFNALTSSAPIEVVNYIEGTITVKNCTFNLECTSSSASAICVSPSNSTKVTVVAEKNIFNAVAATASGEAGTVEQIKVNGTPANIKFISAYDNATVTETGTVKSGIAK